MITKDILIIDDSLAFCESIQDLIEDETPWSVEFSNEGEEGIRKLEKSEYNVVLLDLKMPGISGLDVLSRLEKTGTIKRNYIIVLTGEITIENAVDSLQFGARDFIQKPTVVEYPDLFIKRINKGFLWQDERRITDQLRKEKQTAIEESQLIVKSVGHDMSGSYYGSLVLRLQTLNKKIRKMDTILEETFQADSPLDEDMSEGIQQVKKLTKDSLDRSLSIIELMKFFKELGEKLKHLGNAISIDKSHNKSVDLNSILQNALHVFADSKLKENPNVTVIEEYENSPLNIVASGEDLIRVFLNLIENAYKAMDGDGRLLIRTFKKKGYAYATIEDSGCGIPEDKLDKIWRPDYTFWKNKTGTGLGLLICRKAVENSNGNIEVESIVDKGTTFITKFKINN